ncbi:unnamed protein product [Pseudo-nitzschia multistriata]|uniref:Uncharacterized protein n=1 Tax=Pseudo-nitzschia multistriata TaxID=183589 RepID=A0A448ZQ89_9STRA|nr:unnamed protein product [Pseudo-nitzschia multistriata]
MMSDSGSPYDTMPPTSSSSSSTGTAEGVALWATTLLLVVVSSLVWLRFRDRAWHVPAVTKEGSEAKRVPDAGDDGDGDIRSHGASDALVRAGDGEIDDDDDDMDFGEYGAFLLPVGIHAWFSDFFAAPWGSARVTRVETKIREFYDTIAKHEGRFLRQQKPHGSSAGEDSFYTMIDNEALNIVHVAIAVGSCDEPIALG